MVQQDRLLLMQVIDSGLIFICSFVTVVVFTLTEMGGQPPHTARGHFRCFRVFAEAQPKRTLGAASKGRRAPHATAKL